VTPARRLVPLLLAGALLALAAACGGGGGGSNGGGNGDRVSKAEYQKAFSELGTELVQRFGNLGTTPTTNAAKATYYGQLADGFDAVVSKLEAIVPPADIDQPHRKLTEGARSIAVALRDAEEKAKTSSGIQPRLNLLTLAGFKDVQQALRDIAAKGYTFESTPVTVTVEGGG
jgi:hypothetical protein